jgi:hypothetical protein
MQKEKLIPSHHDFNSIEFEGFRNVETDLRVCSDRNESQEKITMTQKEIFHFTVGQLVEILKSLPQDLPVLTSGYENGFENFYQPSIIKVKHAPENMYYDGEFQVAEDGDEETFDTVVFKRVVRDD